MTPKKKWTGAPGLARTTVPLASLHPSKNNPRQGDVDAVAASLQRFGQVKPVVVLPTGRILAGHHVTKAAAQLGWTHVAVVKVDMTEAEADALLLADNRTSDLGTYDEGVLLKNLEALALLSSEDVDMLAGTGYSTDNVDDLLASVQDRTTEQVPFEGGYNPGLDGKAAAAAGSGAAVPLRDVMLALTVEQAEEFGKAVQLLAKAHGTNGITATVLHVVLAAAEQENTR